MRNACGQAGEVIAVGKGRVIRLDNVEDALRAANVTPDFSFASAPGDSRILFVHRRLPDGEIYYLNNRKPRAERGDARFRVTGRRPRFWRADTGTSEPVSYRIEERADSRPTRAAARRMLYFVVFPAHRRT